MPHPHPPNPTRVRCVRPRNNLPEQHQPKPPVNVPSCRHPRFGFITSRAMNGGSGSTMGTTLHELVREGVPVSSWRRNNLIRREVGQRDALGQTLLHVACLRKEPDLELIRMLLFGLPSFGSSMILSPAGVGDSNNKERPPPLYHFVNARDNDGWTPLHCVCSIAPNPTLIRMLRTSPCH